MGKTEDRAICPHCGAENARHPSVTRCRQCAQLLDASVRPPTIDLPPAPDLPAESQVPLIDWEPAKPESPPPLPTLVPPPRPVPLSLRTVTLFAGSFTQFGWLCLAFALVVVGVICRFSTESKPASTYIGVMGLVALFAIFPLYTAQARVRAVRLLSMGQPAWGSLKEMRPTGASGPGGAQYEITFEFQTEDGELAVASCKTFDPERVRDDRRELVLYDPSDPRQAVLFDSIPGTPHIDEAGQLMPVEGGHAVAVLILPALAALGGGLVIWGLVHRAIQGPAMW